MPILLMSFEIITFETLMKLVPLLEEGDGTKDG